MADIWNPQTYSQFLDIRTRPARDLLSVIPTSFQPDTVYDLGCGPGNSTILLKHRWPNAKIVGLDSSDAMLEEARTAYPDITFIHGDIVHFTPDKKVDCLFANASLQWVDDHQTLIPSLLQCINPDGIFGVQMPNNFHLPTHQVTLRILQNNASWQPLLKKLRYGLLTQPLYNISWYYDLLTSLGMRALQCWETTYYHEMPDYQAILNWVKGTGLRPVLSFMNIDDQTTFAEVYLKAIAEAYPLQANKKILLPFTRLFMVGHK